MGDYRILDTFIRMNRAQLNPGNINYYFDFKQALNGNINFLSRTDLLNLLKLMTTIIAHLDKKAINKNVENSNVHKLLVDNTFKRQTSCNQILSLHLYII